MDTTQLYSIVNEVAAETMGSTDIDVIDTNSLVALGDSILSSQSNTENFLNTFIQRIGKTSARRQHQHTKGKQEQR